MHLVRDWPHRLSATLKSLVFWKLVSKGLSGCLMIHMRLQMESPFKLRDDAAFRMSPPYGGILVDSFV